MVRTRFGGGDAEAFVASTRLWSPKRNGGASNALRSDDTRDPPATSPERVRERSEAVRTKADGLLARSADLIERSRALRQRLGRPDWSEVAVLNVEDHEPARFLRTRILENAGYSVREADSAADAVALVSEPHVRLVLLDVGLPDGTGFDVCARIKSQRAEVPVVMITSIYRSESARRQGLDLGADEYLLEPMPGHRLVGTVDRLLMDAPARTTPAIVATDEVGTIVSLNSAAARLLNLSVRGALGRNILLFVGAERDRVGRGLQLAALGQVVQDEMTLVPRERKRVRVEVDLKGSTEPGDATVEWRIEPLP